MVVIHPVQKLHFHKWDWHAPKSAFCLGAWPKPAVLFWMVAIKRLNNQRPTSTSCLGPLNLHVTDDSIILWVMSFSSQGNPINKTKQRKNKPCHLNLLLMPECLLSDGGKHCPCTLEWKTSLCFLCRNSTRLFQSKYTFITARVKGLKN